MSEFPHGAGRESSRRDWRAAARAWGPPGNERLTTSTGLAADSALAGGHGSKLGRRALSIAAMLLGALIGGLLVLKVDNPAPPVLAVGLLAIVSLFTYRASRSKPAWADA